MEEVTSKLEELYGKSRPSYKDQFWTVGQICAVRFYIDSLWYRGKILKVGIGDSRTYLVLFVDYGNIETCKVTDLRKEVTCLDIPIFSHSCYVADLKPMHGMNYRRQAIDTLHLLTVEKEFFIDVLKNKEEPFPARLTWVQSAEDILETLIENELAIRVAPKLDYDVPDRDLSGSENLTNIVLKEGEKKSDENIAATSIEEPIAASDRDEPSEDFAIIPMIKCEVESTVKSSEEIINGDDLTNEVTYTWDCRIIEIPPSDDITIQVTNVEKDSLHGRLTIIPELPHYILQILLDTDDIETNLQQLGKGLPQLMNISSGLVCIALRNGRFCRGVVDTPCFYKNGDVKVKFIDYGDIRRIPTNHVFTTNDEWFSTPGMAIPMKMDHSDQTNLNSLLFKTITVEISRREGAYLIIKTEKDIFLNDNKHQETNKPLVGEKLVTSNGKSN